MRVVRFIRSGARAAMPPKVTRISCTQTLIAIGASIASCCLYWSGRGLSGPHRWTISSAQSVNIIIHLWVWMDAKLRLPPMPHLIRSSARHSIRRKDAGQSKHGQQRDQRHHSLFVVVIVGLTHLWSRPLPLPLAWRPFCFFAAAAAAAASLVAVFEAWTE